MHDIHSSANASITTAITQEARRAYVETHIAALRGDLQQWLAELETGAQAQSGDLFPGSDR